MINVFALTAYDWEFTEHYLYDARDIPDKKDLDHILKIAYIDAKSKVRSGIRTEPNPDEILKEMVRLLKENGIYPLRVGIYDVMYKTTKEDESL